VISLRVIYYYPTLPLAYIRTTYGFKLNTETVPVVAHNDQLRDISIPIKHTSTLTLDIVVITNLPVVFTL